MSRGAAARQQSLRWRRAPGNAALAADTGRHPRTRTVPAPMRTDPDHDCDAQIDDVEYYENDSGWDVEYCPPLPVHDVQTKETTESHELFQTGDGTVLVYEADTKERVFQLSPAEADAVGTVIPDF